MFPDLKITTLEVFTTINSIDMITEKCQFWNFNVEREHSFMADLNYILCTYKKLYDRKIIIWSDFKSCPVLWTWWNHPNGMLPSNIVSGTNDRTEFYSKKWKCLQIFGAQDEIVNPLRNIVTYKINLIEKSDFIFSLIYTTNRVLLTNCLI